MKQYLPMVLLIAQTQTQTTTSRATAALHSVAVSAGCGYLAGICGAKRRVIHVEYDIVVEPDYFTNNIGTQK